MSFFEHGLAYQANVPINWCPKDRTGLANEEVHNGCCERCGTPVERRDMRQWMLKITAYADRLLEDLDGLDWPESTLQMQRNWIGRSEGAEIDFATPAGPLRVFTTRPDTLFGATYMVLAPEHALVEKLTTPGQKAAVDEYRKQARDKSDLDRTDLAKEKTGVATGSMAINPATGKSIPVWIADYVLAGYGFGAIMAVPAHDSRDHEFAERYDLPIVPVIDEDGKLVDSAQFDGAPGRGGERAIVDSLERARARKARDHVPPPRLGLLASALLGLPDPDRLLRRVRRSSRSRTSSCRSSCPTSRTTSRRAPAAGHRRRTG